MIIRTHTKTYTLMHAWAQTFVDDVTACSVELCQKPMLPGEVVYYVTELDRDENGREQPVCWRHIHPDSGPVTA